MAFRRFPRRSSLFPEALPEGAVVRGAGALATFMILAMDIIMSFLRVDIFFRAITRSISVGA